MRKLADLFYRLIQERHTCDRCRQRGTSRRLGPFVIVLNQTGTGPALICWWCHIRQATRRDAVIRDRFRPSQPLNRLQELPYASY